MKGTTNRTRTRPTTKVSGESEARKRAALSIRAHSPATFSQMTATGMAAPCGMVQFATIQSRIAWRPVQTRASIQSRVRTLRKRECR